MNGEQPARAHAQSIAVIGMAGRFPGAPNLAAFWRNLRDGVESISSFTDEQLIQSGISPAVFKSADYVRGRGILNEVDRFDAPFFGFTPREAELTDPQQRVFLECAWEALEDAAYDPSTYDGLIGVYAGLSMSGYLFLINSNREAVQSTPAFQIMMGNDKDYLPTRVSYKLNLRGPSVAVQTACSTSLVAVHLACQSLLNRECDIALAGGVSIRVPEETGYVYEEGGIGSRDGHCRAYAAEAGGTVSGNGVGVVVLKRLGEALRDGDRVQAVIRGSAINNDGSGKVGYTAPSVTGQAEVIVLAQALAGVSPASIGYVEGHGTATALGDPVEVAALSEAFRAGGATGCGYCGLGSVKSNIGHLDAAAGVAGLIKAVLMLRHGAMPPSLHAARPSERMAWATTPFYVPTRVQAWPAGAAVRRCGVSSFGIGGTNAHVVLEEAPSSAASDAARPWQPVVVSARSAAALEQATAQVSAALAGEAGAADLADLAYTLAVGRRAFAHRRVVVGREVATVRAALATLDHRQVSSGVAPERPRAVVGLFPGTVGATAAVGPALVAQEPGVRAAVEALVAAVPTWAGAPWQGAVGLVVLELALARLWRQWGVMPVAVLGEGVGVLAAAVVAGVIDEAAAVRVAQAVPAGSAAVAAAVARERWAAPVVRWVVGATGETIAAGTPVPAARWAEALGEDASSEAGLRTVVQQSEEVLLELGPGATLMRRARWHVARRPGQVVVATLDGAMDGAADGAVDGAVDGVADGVADGVGAALARGLGRLWVSGVAVDWAGHFAGAVRRRIGLPTYPFERRRYWLAAPAADARSAPVRPLAAWGAVPSWRRSVAPPRLTAAAAAAARWLVLGDDDAMTEGVTRTLTAHGAAPVRVVAGATFAAMGAQRFAVRPGEAADYDALFTALGWREAGGPVRVLQLWPAQSPAAGPTTLPVALERGFYSLLGLAQALGRRHLWPDATLIVGTHALHAVTGEERIVPAWAPVLGPVRVLMREYPGLVCRSVDLASSTLDADARVTRLLAEAACRTGPAVVAWRGAHRWVESLEPLALEAGAPPRIRPGGVYLITGGMGGIGLTLAQALADAAPGVRLALLGRRPVPTGTAVDDRERRTQTAIAALRARGAQVLRLQADVTARAALTAAVETIGARFGRIDGVIHAAGLPGGGLAQLTTRAEAARVLAPKVEGTQILAEVLAGQAADFFVLCSSRSALTGGYGQIDYCAANAFLDAFAHAHAPRVLSINWPRWADVGMAASPSSSLQSSAGNEVDHPLVNRRTDDGSGRGLYLADVSPASHWVLAEHRIAGKAVMPATAYLEMVKAAWTLHISEQPIELRDTVFVSPLILQDAETRSLLLALKEAPDGYEFEIRSRAVSGTGVDSESDLHVTGKIAGRPADGTRTCSLQDISATCQEGERTFAGASSDHDGAMSFGPRWNSLRQVRVGINQGLAALELPEEFSEDLERFTLHPALVDRAVNFANREVGDGFYLPLSFRRILIRGALPGAIYSHLRYRGDPQSHKETLTFDVTIMDEAGTALVEIEEYTLRRRAGLPAQREASAAAPRAASSEIVHAPRGILPHEGVEVFLRILATDGLGQVVVSPEDLEELREAAHDPVPPPSPDTKPIQSVRPAHPRPDLATGYVAPRDDRERRLAEIWEALLGIAPVGVRDNFFELGGDSVSGIRAISKANEAGLGLSLDQLFEYATIAELAAVATNAQASSSTPPAAIGDRRPSPPSTNPSPADFPEAEVTQDDLDELVTRFGRARGLDGE